MLLLTAFGDEPAKQTKAHSCVETSVFKWCGAQAEQASRVAKEMEFWVTEGIWLLSSLPSDARTQTVDVCVCGTAAARLQQMRGPHVRIRQWHGGAAEPDHTSLSRFPLSRWRAAAGAPLPDNYQPSPQMETSVSPHRSRFLPLPPSTAPLYLGKALPTLTMCFVTAD